MRFDRLVLIVLLLVLPVAFWPGSTSYDTIKFTLWALAGAAWLGNLTWRLGTGRSVARTPLGPLAAGISLLAVLSISAVNAHHVPLVWRTVGLTALWLAVVRQVAVTTESTSRLNTLVAAAVTAGVAVCLYGLAQIAGLIPGAPAESGFPPGISTLGNQNYLSGLAAVLLWPSVILWPSTSTARRSAAIAATIIFLVTVIFAKAAGPLAAVAGSILLAGPSLIMVRRGMAHRVPMVLGSSLILLAVAGSILMGDALRVHSATNKAPTLHSRIFQDNHGDIRRTDWLVARKMFRSSPWTGQGAGNYVALWPAMRARLQADPTVTGLADHEQIAAQAHNDVFQFLGETGLTGGVWLVLFSGAAIAFWWRKWPALPDQGTKTQFLLLTAGLLVASLHAMVSFPIHLPATALMLAVIIGLMASGVFVQSTTTPPSWKGKPVLALLPGVLALFLATGAIQEFVGDLFIASGQRYFSAGRMTQATTHLEKGFARQKWPGAGLLYFGLARMATGAPDEARPLLEMSITEKPAFEGYLALAELSIDEERFQEAGDLLTVVENCEPFMTFRFQAAYLRGLSELRQGHRDRARLLFRALLRDDPDNQRAWLALGYQEVLDGNQGKARRYYRRALEIIERKIRDTQGAGRIAGPGELVRLGRHLKTAQKALNSVK